MDKAGEEKKKMIWARFILTAVMGVVLMAWVIFCGIRFIRHSRKLTAGEDFVGHVRCEKCGTEYTVKAGDFNKSPLILITHSGQLPRCFAFSEKPIQIKTPGEKISPGVY